MVDRHHQACLLSDPGVPARGWAAGSQTGSGITLDLLGEAAAITTLTELPERVMTIAFSGPPKEDLLPWGAEAWRDLEEAVGRLSPEPGQLLLRGHHKHVLADGPASLRWLDRCREIGLPCGIALSPASMLAPSMIEARDDHLTRLFEYLGPRCDAVILEDVTRLDDENIQGVTVGMGLLDGCLLGTLLEAHVPREIPLVVHAADLEQADQWLWPD